MTAASIVSHLVTGIVWFIGGYFVGRAGLVINARPKWRQVARTVGGLALIALVAAGVVAGNQRANERESAAKRAEQREACQAAYNALFAAGLEERAGASAADRQAARLERDAMRALLATPPGSTPEQRRAALQRYVDALNQADRLLAEADTKRSANPIPQRPAC